MSKVTPKTFKGCSEIPIYNFMMMLHQLDYTFLISNIDSLSDNQITNFVTNKKEYLSGVFNSINEEYSGLTFEKKELEREKELIEMKYLEMKHNTVIRLVKIFQDTKEIKVLGLLNKIGFKFSQDKPINPQIKKLDGYVIGLRNKLNIKTANFKAKYKVTDEELNLEKGSNVDNVEANLDAQALMLEGNLETGYHIDIKKTSVLRWLNLMKANEAKIQQLNKS